MQLQGAKVLITGATGGLGAALAEAFAAQGATLVLTGRRVETLAGLAERYAATTVEADLATPAGREAVASSAADVDVAVANAGLPASGTLDRLGPNDIDRALAVNLAAPIHLAAALLPAMRARGRGHLAFMSSLAGVTASESSSLYSATKFGLRGFALGLRQDLHGTGVGVSVILPGFVRDAGMLANSGAVLPRGVGTATPKQVADATVRAIVQDLAEVAVGPFAVRVGAYLGGVLPAPAARLTRLLGGRKVAESVAGGQQGWG